MDSEVTNLAQVKSFDSSDYATAAQGTKADTAIQPSQTSSFSTATGVEDNADVTDTANVTAAGALMDSEVTSLSLIKGLTAAQISGAFDAASASLASDIPTNNNQLTNGAGYLTTVDISSDTNLAVGNGITLTGDTLTVTAGTGLTQNVGGLSFDADGGTLTTSNADVDHILINDGGTFKRITKSNINVGDFNNDAGYLTSSPFTAAGISGSFDSVSASLAADIPTNNNQLTNGAGYTTNTGTVTSVGGTGTVSGLSLSGTVTTSGNLTLGGTISISSTNITDVDAFSQTGTYTSLRAQGTTAGDVGLGNVTNESKATMFTSPTFTGTTAAPTPSTADDSTKIATTAYVQSNLDNLIGNAGAALDTLGELSASLADATGSIESLVTEIDGKLAKSSNLSDLTNAATARTNLGVDAAGTDNSTDVTLAGSYDYITISGQQITRNQIDASTDISNLTTTNVSEGTNEYYTDAKVKTKLNTENVVSGSATQVRSFLNVEDGADVTDTANVQSALSNQNLNLGTGDLTTSEVIADGARFGGASALRSFNVQGSGLNGRLSIQGASTSDNPGIEMTVNDNTSRVLLRLNPIGTDGTELAIYTEPDGGSITEVLTVQSDGTLDLNSNDITGVTDITASGNVDIQGTLSLPGFSDVSASLASAVAGGDNLGNHTATQDLNMGGNAITSVGNVDGVDVSALNTSVSTNTTNITTLTAATSSYSTATGVEDNADVTDTANVTAAGALMDSELSEIATVKALTAAGISGSFNAASASFSTRVTANDAKLTANTSNVQAAGALMDSEVTNLAQVKAFDSSDYATAAQGTKADTAIQPSQTSSFSTATGVEDNADVTDTANVTAAGALMDSEVTNLAQVKALKQTQQSNLQIQVHS